MTEDAQSAAVEHDIRVLRRALQGFDDGLNDRELVIRAAWALAAPRTMVTIRTKTNSKDRPKGNLPGWEHVKWINRSNGLSRLQQVRDGKRRSPPTASTG